MTQPNVPPAENPTPPSSMWLEYTRDYEQWVRDSVNNDRPEFNFEELPDDEIEVLTESALKSLPDDLFITAPGSFVDRLPEPLANAWETRTDRVIQEIQAITPETIRANPETALTGLNLDYMPLLTPESALAVRQLRAERRLGQYVTPYEAGPEGILFSQKSYTDILNLSPIFVQGLSAGAQRVYSELLEKAQRIAAPLNVTPGDVTAYRFAGASTEEIVASADHHLRDRLFDTAELNDLYALADDIIEATPQHAEDLGESTSARVRGFLSRLATRRREQPNGGGREPAQPEAGWIPWGGTSIVEQQAADYWAGRSDEDVLNLFRQYRNNRRQGERDDSLDGYSEDEVKAYHSRLFRLIMEMLTLQVKTEMQLPKIPPGTRNVFEGYRGEDLFELLISQQYQKLPAVERRMWAERVSEDVPISPEAEGQASQAANAVEPGHTVAHGSGIFWRVVKFAELANISRRKIGEGLNNTLNHAYLIGEDTGQKLLDYFIKADNDPKKRSQRLIAFGLGVAAAGVVVYMGVDVLTSDHAQTVADATQNGGVGQGGRIETSVTAPPDVTGSVDPTSPPSEVLDGSSAPVTPHKSPLTDDMWSSSREARTGGDVMPGAPTTGGANPLDAGVSVGPTSPSPHAEIIDQGTALTRDHDTVWEASDQYWQTHGFTGSEDQRAAATDLLTTWRVEQMDLSDYAVRHMAEGTALPTPPVEEIQRMVEEAMKVSS